MRVLMLVQSPVVGDSRVVREARTLADAGHEVTVVGRGVPAGAAVPGIEVLDAGRSAGLGSAAGATGRGWRDGARRSARWALLPEHRERVEARWRSAAADVVRNRPADVVHAHDRNTLVLAVGEARRRDVPLVYDAHELWSDRGLPGRPAPLRTLRQTRHETRWATAADLVLTVSEGIADVLRARGVGEVHLVRNSFPALSAPLPAPERPTGLLYAGRLGAGRDLATLVASAGLPGGLPVTLVGPADPHVAARLTLPPHVSRLPAMPVDDLDPLYVQHGIAAIPLTAGVRNHQLALPNKLFHAVRAGVPVVAADLPELRRVVTEHGIGELYTPGDPGSLAAATQRVRDGYPRLLEGVARARAELSWERDARVLLDGYARLAR